MTALPPRYLYTVELTGASTRRQTVRTVWAIISRMLGIWNHRVRSRRALNRLNQHYLADIGLTDEDVRQEIAKPFWIK